MRAAPWIVVAAVVAASCEPKRPAVADVGAVRVVDAGIIEAGPSPATTVPYPKPPAELLAKSRKTPPETKCTPRDRWVAKEAAADKAVMKATWTAIAKAGFREVVAKRDPERRVRASLSKLRVVGPNYGVDVDGRRVERGVVMEDPSEPGVAIVRRDGHFVLSKDGVLSPLELVNESQRIRFPSASARTCAAAAPSAATSSAATT